MAITKNDILKIIGGLLVVIIAFLLHKFWPDPIPPVADILIDEVTGPVPHIVQFNSNSYDPEGQKIENKWFLNDTLISDDYDFTYTFNKPGNYSVRLEVKDSDGLSSSKSTFIKAVERKVSLDKIKKSNSVKKKNRKEMIEEIRFLAYGQENPLKLYVDIYISGDWQEHQIPYISNGLYDKKHYFSKPIEKEDIKKMKIRTKTTKNKYGDYKHTACISLDSLVVKYKSSVLESDYKRFGKQLYIFEALAVDPENYKNECNASKSEIIFFKIH